MAGINSLFDQAILPISSVTRIMTCPISDHMHMFDHSLFRSQAERRFIGHISGYTLITHINEVTMIRIEMIGNFIVITCRAVMQGYSVLRPFKYEYGEAATDILQQIKIQEFGEINCFVEKRNINDNTKLVIFTGCDMGTSKTPMFLFAALPETSDPIFIQNEEIINQIIDVITIRMQSYQCPWSTVCVKNNDIIIINPDGIIKTDISKDAAKHISTDEFIRKIIPIVSQAFV